MVSVVAGIAVDVFESDQVSAAFASIESRDPRKRFLGILGVFEPNYLKSTSSLLDHLSVICDFKNKEGKD